MSTLMLRSKKLDEPCTELHTEHVGCPSMDGTPLGSPPPYESSSNDRSTQHRSAHNEINVRETRPGQPEDLTQNISVESVPPEYES